MKYMILLLMLFVSSCSNDKKEDCIKQSSNGNRNDYLCPKEVPDADSIIVSYISPVIEAGEERNLEVTIRNDGKFDIFDISMNAPHNCPEILEIKQECNINILLSDIKAGNKYFDLKINDITKKLNTNKKINYIVRPKLPDSVNYNLVKNDESNYTLTLFDNFDEYGNLFDGFLKIQSDAHLSLFGDIFSNVKTLDLKTDFGAQITIKNSSNSDNFFDVNFESFYDFEVNESSLTVLFLKEIPIFDSLSAEFHLDEDTEKQLLNLPRSNSDGAMYQIIQNPNNGIIKNCLIANEIFDISNCSYKPKNNFYGVDTFKYKAMSSTGNLSEVVIVTLNVSSTNDIISLTSEPKQLYALKNEQVDFILKAPINPDNKNLQYSILNSTVNGILNCSGRMCSYKSNNNYVGNDSFTYSIDDGESILIENYVVFVKDKIEKPIITINEINTSLNEDETLVVELPPVDNGIKYVLQEIGSNISVTACNTHSCLVTPKKDFFGNSYFRVKLVNEFAMNSDFSILVNLTINPINDAPKFLSDSVGKIIVTNEPTSIILDNAFDVEGDNLSIVITKMPINGILNNCSNIQNGIQCLYSNNTSLADYIEYKAIDPHGAESDVFRYYLSFSNPNAPIFLSYTKTISSENNKVINFDLESAIDFDVNDTLRYRIVTLPSKGLLSGCLNLLESESLTDLSCQYTPDIENGTFTFKYKAIDTYGSESIAVTVTLNITNPQTVFDFQVKEEVMSLNEDSILNFSFSLPSYPNGEEVIYSYDTTNLQGNINCIINNCTYTPPINYNGISYFIVKAIIGSTEKTKKIFLNVSPINDTPTFVSNTMYLEAYEDVETNLQLMKASDVDNALSDLNYILVSNPNNGYLSNCLGFLNDNSNCTYLPKNNFNGVDNFSYRAFDGISYSEIITVSINVIGINDAPAMDISSEINVTLDSGEISYIKFNRIVEFDNETYTINVVSNPNIGSIISCNMEGCSYYSNSTGNDSFVVAISDGNLISNNYQINLRVEPKKTLYFSDLYKNQISSANNFSLNFKDVFIVNDVSRKIYLINQYGTKQEIMDGLLISNESVIINEFIYFLISRDNQDLIIKMSPDGIYREYEILLQDGPFNLYNWNNKVVISSGNNIGLLNEFYYKTNDFSSINWIKNVLNQQLNEIGLFKSVHVLGSYKEHMYVKIDDYIYSLDESLKLLKISNINYSSNIFLYDKIIFAEYKNDLKISIIDVETGDSFDEILKGQVSQFSVFDFYNRNKSVLIVANGEVYRYNDRLYKTNIKSDRIDTYNNLLYYIKGSKAFVYENDLNKPAYEIQNVSNVLNIEGELYFHLINNQLVNKDNITVANFRMTDIQINKRLFIDGRPSSMAFKILNNSKDLDFFLGLNNSLSYLQGLAPHQIINSNNCQTEIVNFTININGCDNMETIISYKDVNNNVYSLNIKPKNKKGYFKTNFNIELPEYDYFFKGLKLKRINDEIFYNDELISDGFVKYRDELIIFNNKIFDLSNNNFIFSNNSVIDAIKNNNITYYLTYDMIYKLIYNGFTINLPIDLIDPKIVTNKEDVFIFGSKSIYKLFANNTIQLLYEFDDSIIINIVFIKDKAYVNLKDYLDGLPYNKILILDTEENTTTIYNGYNSTTDSSLSEFMMLSINKFFLIGTIEFSSNSEFFIYNGVTKQKLNDNFENIYNISENLIFKSLDNLEITAFNYKDQKVDDIVYIPKYSILYDYQIMATHGQIGSCEDKDSYIECAYVGDGSEDSIYINIISNLEVIDSTMFNINKE